MDYIEEDLDVPPHCRECQNLRPLTPGSSPTSRGCAGSSTSSSPKYISKRGEPHWSKVFHVTYDDNRTLVVDQGQIALQFVCNCSVHKKRRKHHSKHTLLQVPDVKDTNIFTNLYQRFCKWIGKRRSSSSSSKGQGKRTSRSHLRLTDLPPNSPDSGYPGYTGFPPCSPDFSDCQSPVMSETSEYSSFTLASSSTSSFTVISTPSGSHSNVHFDSLISSPEDSLGDIADFRNKRALLERLFASRVQLNNKWDRKSLSSESLRAVGEGITRRKSWPQLSNCEESYEEEPPSLLGQQSWWVESTDTVRGTIPHDKRNPLSEFSIQYGDIELTECIRHGRIRRIQRGRWHGDVTVHTFSQMNRKEESAFRRHVAHLSKLRHENVVLYMGACLEPPHFAIVASTQRRESLYQTIHMRDDRLGAHRVLDIARQVALAVEYLHAKAMVVSCLKSRNVFLESKVKLSLVDESFSELHSTDPSCACVTRGHMTYLAPELLQSLHVEDGELLQREKSTTKSDAFAFGTLLYEMLSSHFPMGDWQPEVIIWQVCSGKRSCLRHLNTKSTVKRLIRWCWEQYPAQRPDFEDVNENLQNNIVMNRRHSTSSPVIPFEKSDIKFYI